MNFLIGLLVGVALGIFGIIVIALVVTDKIDFENSSNCTKNSDDEQNNKETSDIKFLWHENP